MKSYKFLEEILHKVKNIENTIKTLNQSLLSIEDKIEQVNLLEEIKHEMISHNLIKESLAEAFSNKKNANDQQLKLIDKMYKNSSAIPVDLVKSLSKTKIECQNLWHLSRLDVSNLEKLKERFADLIKLMRESASIRSQQLKCSKYDSLLADYSSDITEKNVKEIFSKIGKFFSENIDKIIEKQKQDKATNTTKIAVEKQMELSSICLEKMGVSSSLIDYDESDFCFGLFSLLRHTMYPAQNSINSAIKRHDMHEIQSLFMEKMIGTSKEFTEFIQPHIKKTFTTKGKMDEKANSVENLYLLFNKVNLSPFLKNADQLSLLAHIMLRTKLEQDLINGVLEVQDLHDAWLSGMNHYKIPVKAKNELDTYFQDEYWVSGVMGYFPIKIIALIAAAQIFSFIQKNHQKFLDSITKEDFSLLLDWLSQNVYNTKYSFSELLKKITGKGLDVGCYIGYLSEKYSLSQ
ncbi:carboxypeptidase M32 [Wolbachia endosymbiont of Ctenocephalides felis wCfeT]|uniref:carboxypeptidase M32 n=1 Tax=Wolbachia endosymbiont of Ctenocephalides felis wCfeT TaxID=2732593 RepID=UPI00144745BD|nr:carboxypeptidase M32 [Wolbachia endosymbiont of Ctenocephalides felis wCfeT]